MSQLKTNIDKFDSLKALKCGTIRLVCNDGAVVIDGSSAGNVISQLMFTRYALKDGWIKQLVSLKTHP